MQMRNAPISSTDWAILRVLWEHPNCSTGAIHEQLVEERGWTKSTVKTLVSRLVDKGYLSVNLSERYPTYSCVYTEEQCVHQEMRATVLRIYGDNLIVSHGYFDIYGYADNEYVSTILSHANKHYKQICNTLELETEHHQSIMIHKSLQNLHSALGQSSAPDWLRIGENYGLYHLAPKHHFDTLPLEGALSFIIANVEIDKQNHGLPFYFKQGLATVLSSLQMDAIIKPIHQELIALIDNNRLMDLLVEEDKIGEMRQHELAYLFLSFLIHKHGFSTIRDITHGRRRLSVMFKHQETLTSEWIQYIQATYK